MPLAPPTGTVTFLFSDIEGSTLRWDEYRYAMSEALQRHDAIMRHAIETHGGFVFKTVGDEFCSAFATPGDAMSAAIDAQHALAAADFSAVGGLRVRMALHAGTAEMRDDDYFGPPVNRVARLLSAAYGGQILLSNVVKDLLEGEKSPQSELRDLGSHRLKDLSSEHIYQLVAPDLADSFPALRSLDSLPNNLPPQLNAFVGREDEIREIKTLLQQAPLLTLIGTGGAGKTRCATQAAAELIERFTDGAWLVELAPISDASLIPDAIAQALNVQLLPNKRAFETVIHFLKHKQLLLVLDNCEHVIGEASKVSAAILRECKEVHILATSRERLNVAGEVLFPMPSLPVEDATKLFAARATSADSHFELTAQNSPVVADICRRVDGIPLAIELAAARVKVLSPAELLRRLDDRFRVLTGGDRTALPRHQTMRALIDWSYDLLTDDERVAFAKLGIFAGGFTLEAAQAVCEPLDELGVLDVITSLVDKSLLQVDAGAESTRYRFLESTRQYAREQLIRRGEYNGIARAHALYFLTLAASVRDLNNVSDEEWFARASPELDNWRTALEWALGTREDVVLGQRIVAASRRIWTNVAAAEGAQWLRLALDTTSAATPSEVVGELDQTESQLMGVMGLHKLSLDAAERALLRYRQAGDVLGIANAQRQMGRALVILGQVDEGERLLNEALKTFRRVGDRALTGATLENVGIARGAVGDIAGARAAFTEALALFKEIGAARLASAIENNLAESEFRAGNVLEAMRLSTDALTSGGTIGVAWRRALLLSNRSAYLIALERYGEARETAREALSMARTLDYATTMTWAMQHIAASYAVDPGVATDELERAASLLGYVDARVGTLQMIREYTEQHEYDAAAFSLRAALGEERVAIVMSEGAAWNEDRAVAEALNTCS